MNNIQILIEQNPYWSDIKIGKKMGVSIVSVRNSRHIPRKFRKIRCATCDQLFMPKDGNEKYCSSLCRPYDLKPLRLKGKELRAKRMEYYNERTKAIFKGKL